MSMLKLVQILKFFYVKVFNNRPLLDEVIQILGILNFHKGGAATFDLEITLRISRQADLLGVKICCDWLFREA